jgi:hypothetical protein
VPTTRSSSAGRRKPRPSMTRRWGRARAGRCSSAARPAWTSRRPIAWPSPTSRRVSPTRCGTMARSSRTSSTSASG